MLQYEQKVGWMDWAGMGDTPQQGGMPRPGLGKMAAPAPKVFKSALPRPENAPSLTVTMPRPQAKKAAPQTVMT